MVGTNTIFCPGFRAARSSATVWRMCTTGIRSETVNCVVRKSPAFHLGDVLAHSGIDAGAAVHEVAHELERLTARYPQHVVQHQNLAAATGPGADADGRNRQHT